MLSLTVSACKAKGADNAIQAPEFENVTVHDPSVIYTEDEYYVFGSHLQAAKSENLTQWQQISKSVPLNTLFEDVYKEFAEEFEYAKTDTFWAPDVIQLKDGRYYLYYCLCKGDQPLSVLGVAVADNIEGPYEKIESFLYSGTSPQFGETYDATKDPNAVDPNVFFDKEGKLWMVYGSYSGGIFILEMDENTGLPKDRNTYGKKLTGGNHSRIEAPYILYNEETDYYYLFTSFGGLDSFGGYNMRVARSKSPDGPYFDILNQSMEEAKGKEKSFFDDLSIEGFGNKLMGNFTYVEDDGLTNDGYVSAGHNSVLFDEKTKDYYVFFHTRFPNGGENHELRVHKLYFTTDGWPIMSPLRYSGEEITKLNKKQIAGDYKWISTTKEIIDWIEEPIMVSLEKKGSITGVDKGNWHLAESSEEDSTVEIDGEQYRGQFLYTWDQTQETVVISFTGVSQKGIPLFLIEDKK